jgi:hypothetical protein
VYGLPIERKYPMNDMMDVKYIIENFNDCPLHKRYILASNIKKAFTEFNINKPFQVSESNSICKFLNKDFVIVTENTISTNNKLNEIDVLEFKTEVLRKFNTQTNEFCIESFMEENIFDRFFNENDISRLKNRIEYLRQYGLINDLDDVDKISALSSIKKAHNDYIDNHNSEIGTMVCINDNLYIVCKENRDVDNYILLPADTMNLDGIIRVPVFVNENKTTIKNLLKRINKD